MPDRLDFQLHVPDNTEPGAPVAVLLHGRGSDMGDLQALAPALPPDWVLVTPQAPFAGAEWGYGPGWAWYRYVAENRVVEDSLEHSLERLDRFLADLPGIIGFEPGPITLGGFSQGGTMSVAYGLTRPGAVRAALNFSGFLAASVPVPEGEALEDDRDVRMELKPETSECTREVPGVGVEPRFSGAIALAFVPGEPIVD